MEDKSDCVLCRIMEGTLPCLTIYEDENVKCIVSKEMEVYGHTLIIPKRHFENIWNISSEQLHYIADAIQHLSVLFKEKLGATGINVLHASGKDAGQSVCHFHVHVFPRFSGDGVDAWPHLPKKEFDKMDFVKRIISKD